VQGGAVRAAIFAAAQGLRVESIVTSCEVGLSLERIDEVTSAARLRLSLMHAVALGGTR